MKNAYTKSILREIKNSKGRFFSILIIIFLGVAIFVGIKSTGPDIKNSMLDEFKQQQLMDGKIVSTLGLNNNDLNLVKKDSQVAKYYPTYSIDINLSDQNEVVKFFSYNQDVNINKVQLIQGRMPISPQEIALDANLLDREDNQYQIVSKYIIKAEKDKLESLKNTEYKVVGFVKSSMYLGRTSKGSSKEGDGVVDYFAYINDQDFDMDVFSEIYVTYKNASNLDGYSQEYRKSVDQDTENLKKLFKGRASQRQKEVKNEIIKELNKNEKKLLDAEKKIKDGQTKLDEGQKEYQDGLKQYQDGVQTLKSEIAKGQKQIDEGKAKITSGQKSLKGNEKKLKKGQKEIKTAQKKLDQAKQALEKEGINPNKDLTKYQDQLSQLNKSSQQLKSLSSSVKQTLNVEDLKTNQALVAQLDQVTSDSSSPLANLKMIVDGMKQSLSAGQTNLDTLKNQFINGVNAIENELSKNIPSLEKLVKGIQDYQNGQSEVDKNKKSIDNGLEQIKQGKKDLTSNAQKLEDAQKTLDSERIKGNQKLVESKNKLDQAKATLDKSQKELNTNKAKVEKNRKDFNKKKKELLNDVEKPSYYFTTRDDLPGYSMLKNSISSLDTIANVFPVFFFLIAILICLSSMTRMVEEKRGEVGTLKALGYTDYEIAKKYLIYALIATVIGLSLGVIVGSTLIPMVIANAYGNNMNLAPLHLSVYPEFVIQATIFSLISTVGAAYFALKSELKEVPSNLMRPKAPKLGKKILLERITPLWSRLNFNQKVTFRNLFRYKQRMVMTVLGISGCTALLIVGFALNSSNNGVITRQFDDVWQYQAMVTIADDTNNENKNNIVKKINEYQGFKEEVSTYQEAIQVFNDETKDTLTLVATNNPTKLNDFIRFKDRVSQQPLTFENDGALLSEKMADYYKVKAGDTINVMDEDSNKYQVKVKAITENYINNYLYMSQDYYQKVFNKKEKDNSFYVKLASDVNQDQFMESLMQNDDVLNVSTIQDIKKNALEATGSLGAIMIVIIGASGALALVVLYNLNTINVSERIRELSTIKVLGFYDNEVTMYILRENIILTFMGIFVGYGLGNLLYWFIIGTDVGGAAMMFIPDVSLTTYIYSGLITFAFSLLVMYIIHIKLKNVDMIDALKSVE